MARTQHNRADKLVVFNSRSTNARRMRRQMRELRDNAIAHTYIHTDANPEETSRRLLNRAHPGDTILVAGGDGTANLVMNALMSHTAVQRGLDTVRIAFLRGGGASDTPVMHNGKDTALEVLEQAIVHQLHPLEVTVENARGTYVRRALGTAGVGADAGASLRLEELKAGSNAFTRTTRIQTGRQVLGVWQKMGDGSTMMVERDGGEPVEVSDEMYYRGHIVAELGRPHAHLLKQQFEHIESPQRNMTAALVDMLRMQRSALYGTMTDHDSFVVTSHDGSPVLTQYDGEVAPIASGSRVTFGISEQSFNALATQL